jgi:hypothetical protein
LCCLGFVLNAEVAKKSRKEKREQDQHQNTQLAILQPKQRLGYHTSVGSLRFGGVRFVAYSNDHPPRHVHGFAGDTEAIIDLRLDGTVTLAERADAIRPANAKRSDVKKILNSAALHFEELAALWEAIHGEA